MADALPHLILTNGLVRTLDVDQPVAEAIAFRGQKVVACGAGADIEMLRGPRTEVIDVRGQTVLPGFHDAHLHFIWYGMGLAHVDLAEVPSLSSALERVAQRVGTLPDGAWLQGGGWNHDLWGGVLPTRLQLDQHTAGHPALLRRKDGHSIWVNSRAIEVAGVSSETPDPPGGRIHRDASGEPTGIFAETAIDLIAQHVPVPSKADRLQGLKAATKVAQQFGITSIHDMEDDNAFITFQVQWHAGTLGVRVTMQLARDNFEKAVEIGLTTGQGHANLRVGALKLFSDGALGSRTAAMLAPYDGEPDNRGLLVTEQADLLRYVSQASAAGIACAIHAIGDRANRVVLDVFERTQHLWQPRGLRQRIEHVQLLAPEDLPRLAAMNIVASMQPIHATQDMDAADRYWGRRSRLGYAWKSLARSGATLAFGSDAPVETMDVRRGIHAAVTRQRTDGTPAGGWYPDERLSIMEALHAYTTGAAYAAGVENQVGKLVPGMVADAVILSDDPVTVPHQSLLDIRVVGTVFDGQVVYNDGLRT